MCVREGTKEKEREREKKWRRVTGCEYSLREREKENLSKEALFVCLWM